MTAFCAKIRRGLTARMDYETPRAIPKQVVKIADRSDCSEMEVASEVLALAREAQEQPREDPRMTLRDSHVGFYLLAEGTASSAERGSGFHPRSVPAHAHVFASASG